MISKEIKNDEIVYTFINSKGKVKKLKIDKSDSFNDEIDKLKNDNDKINALINYSKPTPKGKEKIRVMKLAKDDKLTKKEEEDKNKEILNKIFNYDVQINELNNVLERIKNNFYDDDDEEILNKYNVKKNINEISNKINELTNKKDEEQKKIYKLKTIDLKQYVNNQIGLLNKNYSFFTYKLLETIKNDKDVQKSINEITSTNETVKEFLDDDRIPIKTRNLIAAAIDSKKFERDFKDIIEKIEHINSIIDIFTKKKEKTKIENVGNYSFVNVLKNIKNCLKYYDDNKELINDVVMNEKNDDIKRFKIDISYDKKSDKLISKGKETIKKLNYNDLVKDNILITDYDEKLDINNINDKMLDLIINKGYLTKSYVKSGGINNDYIYYIIYDYTKKLILICGSSVNRGTLNIKNGYFLNNFNVNYYLNFYPNIKFIQDEYDNEINVFNLNTQKQLNNVVELIKENNIEFDEYIEKLINDLKLKEINFNDDYDEDDFYQNIFKLINAVNKTESKTQRSFLNMLLISYMTQSLLFNDEELNEIKKLLTGFKYNDLIDLLNKKLSEEKEKRPKSPKIPEVEETPKVDEFFDYVNNESSDNETDKEEEIIDNINKLKNIMDEEDSEKKIKSEINDLLNNEQLKEDIINYIKSKYTNEQLNDFNLNYNDIENLSGKNIYDNLIYYDDLFNKLTKIELNEEGRKIIVENNEIKKVMPERKPLPKFDIEQIKVKNSTDIKKFIIDLLNLIESYGDDEKKYNEEKIKLLNNYDPQFKGNFINLLHKIAENKKEDNTTYEYTYKNLQKNKEKVINNLKQMLKDEEIYDKYEKYKNDDIDANELEINEFETDEPIKPTKPVEPIKPPNKGLTLSDIAGRLDRIEGIIKDSLRIKPKNNDIIYQLQHFYD